MFHTSTRIDGPGRPALHVRERGQGDTTLLMIHGFGDGSFIWGEFAETLALPCRMVAPDLRGHGDSDTSPDGCYGLVRHVDDMIWLIEYLDMRKVVLIGHSMGANVAIDLAHRLPDRIHALVVVDFGPDMASAGRRRLDDDFRESHRPYNNVKDYAEWLMAKRPLMLPDVVRRVAAEALRKTADGSYRLKSDLKMLENGDDDAAVEARSRALWSIFPTLNLPTLIVRGAGSAVFSLPVARRMAQLIPGAEFSTVDIAGHAVVTDDPPGFYDSVHGFLARAMS